ncbi:MAG: TIGR02391 family protein [Acidimicrobiia bacterium]|nr:TIGR02391 family protein [Acidimicrobiia bacterium]
MSELTTLADDQLCSLSIDRLGLVVLAHLEETGEWHSGNFVKGAAQRGVSVPAQRCLVEAVNWLVAKGLIARGTPGQSGSEAVFVTRLGQSVLEEGLRRVNAAERLHEDLHHLLTKVRSQFLLGEYELAAFAAMREVEIRVRELADADSALIGVKLMREAFKNDGGPLSDPNLDPGERVGVMELFAGAIGTFKNPPSHRQVDYTDPIEASEVVFLADLLMRLLDRAESRLALGVAETPE